MVTHQIIKKYEQKYFHLLSIQSQREQPSKYATNIEQKSKKETKN